MKTLLVPKKIKFEDHSILQSIGNKVRPNSEGKKKSSIRKLGPPEKVEPSTNPLEVENIDLMKYWLRHRGEENSMNGVIGRIREKRKVMRGCEF